MGRIRHRRPRNRPSLRYELSPDGAFRTYPDGREVCCENRPGQIEYRRRTMMMAQRQNFICPECNRLMDLRAERLPYESDVTFDHERPRGFGGGFRDDRIVLPDGTWLNRAVHFWCNSKRGSKRL